MEQILTLLILFCQSPDAYTRANCLRDKVICMGGKHDLINAVRNEDFYQHLLACIELSGEARPFTHHR